jgi:two-component system osmolarity sensor histidine kinase EnvZ
MESIQNDLNAINHLIGETLSISLELEEGEEMLTDVGRELKQIVEKIHTNGLEVIFSQEASCRQRLCPLALRRIFTNLLVNAVRYGENKPIQVLYDCNSDQINIQILDQGPGISPEFSKVVFQPFYRLEKSRGSGTGGSGLGLAIVRQLADANQWDVQLLPRSSGGTKAVITIPRD